MKNTIIRTLLIFIFITIAIKANGQVNAIWASSFKSTYEDFACKSVADNNGSVYTVGLTKVLDGANLSVIIIKYDKNGFEEWHDIYDSITANQNNIPDIAMDNLGYIYVTNSSNLSSDIIKYNSSGTRIWKINNINDWSGSKNITLDNYGNIFLTCLKKINTDYRVVLIKYNNSNSLIWEYEYLNYNAALSVIKPSIDNSGNLIIAGRVAVPQLITYQYRWEAIFLAKISSAGSLTWDTIYSPIDLGTLGGEVLKDLKIDNSNNIYISGCTQTCALASRCGEYGYVIYYYKAVIAKFSADGIKLWDDIYANLPYFDDAFVQIELDNSGNAYVAGYSYTEKCIGGYYGNYIDFLVIKYDNTGTKLWLRNCGISLQNDIAVSMDIDNNSNLYIAGNYNNKLALVKYDSNGNLLWENVSNTNGTASHIIIGPNNDIIVTGNRTNYPSQKDILVVKYSANYPVSGITNYVHGSVFNREDCIITDYTIPFVPSFNNGNKFIAQISDSAGDFSLPVNLGYIDNTASSTVYGTIPWNSFNGYGYRVRIVSTNPLSIGMNNGSDILITSTPVCNFLDCSSETDCGGSVNQNEVYLAVQYLCSRHIVRNVCGNVFPNNLITRAQLAKISLYGVYGDSVNVPNPIVSDFFPSPYADLQDPSTFYYRAAKALLYLEYGDGKTPFDRDRFNFEPNGTISRRLVLKVMLETFNITPSSNATAVFTDFQPNEDFYSYAKKAEELGIITTGAFRPYESCTRGEAFVFLYKIMTIVGLPSINNSLSLTSSSFFIPINMKIASMATNLGVEAGNFNNYTKSCFAIPGRSLSLDFDFSYNSYLTELPSEIFPLEPLGNAWSHNYNMYINIINGATEVDDKLIIHMPDGSILVYKKQAGSFVPETQGNYNTLTYVSSLEYQFKTKNQVVYTLKKFSENDIAYVLTSIKDRNDNTIFLNYVQGINYTIPGTQLTKTTRNISTVIDPSGRTLSFTYHNGTNFIASIADPLNRTIFFNYTNNRLSTYTDAKGQNTTYNYGTTAYESGLLMSIQLPKGNIITNQYQKRKLTSTRYNNNSSTTIAHTPNYVSGNTDFYKSRVTIPQVTGQNIITNYETDKKGKYTKISGNNAVNVSFTYNNQTHPTLPSVITNNLNNITITPSYDQSGNITQLITAGNSLTTTQTFLYNSNNDVIQHTDANGGTTYYYYTNGNLVKVRDALNNETNIINNDYGQPTSIISPSSVAVNFGYDNYGNQNLINVPSLGLNASMDYDVVGRMISSTNFNGQTKAYTYDHNDNLLTENDAMNYTTSYTYDPNDNLISITNAKGYATTFNYDNNTDWLLSESFQGATKTYQYNLDGSLKKYTNPNGTALNYTYDNSGRVTNDGYATYSYLANGNLSTITKSGKVISFGYNGLNRVTCIGYDGDSVKYSYDNLGNVLSMTYPGNKIVLYTYDATNKLKTVTDWNNHTTTYNYRPDGQLSNILFPNNVKTTYTYDNAGRKSGMTTKRNTGSGTTIADYGFTLDPLGNHIKENITEQFATYPNIPNQNQIYTYSNANRIQNTGNINFSFDNNGNNIGKTGYTYSYDALNNLTSISGNFTAVYSYDGAGNRREATRNNVLTKYVIDILGMSNILMEKDMAGTVKNYYVYGLGLISRIKPDNTTHYYVFDYRGSTVAMVDATTSANVTHKYQYDDFGNILQMQETDTNLFRYIGKYGAIYEDSTLSFMRIRYYDPTIGRFLSEDPIWSTNLYPYTENNPIEKIDPSGAYSETLKAYIDIYAKVAPQVNNIYNNAQIIAKSALTEAEHIKSSGAADGILNQASSFFNSTDPATKQQLASAGATSVSAAGATLGSAVVGGVMFGGGLVVGTLMVYHGLVKNDLIQQGEAFWEKLLGNTEFVKNLREKQRQKQLDQMYKL